jgi:MFS family permease
MGFGIINFLFALPAIWTIDSFGRRSLLLSTFPLMALSQIIMVIAFALPKRSSAQHVLVILGMYLFGVAYSPGEGPVPFVYSAESMPLYNRDFGMGIVTSVNWFWNFFISITWPKFSAAFGYSGAFGWYAAWCVLGFFMILFLVPETKDMTLEELDQVFDRHTMDYVNYGMKELKWFVGRWLLMRKGTKKPPPFLQRKDPEEIYDTRGEAFGLQEVVHERM